MTHRAAGPVALAMLVVHTAGCFRYVTADLAAVPDGESVRMLVSPEGLEEVRVFSPEAEPMVSGTIVRHEEESLMLSIPLARGREARLDATIGQAVRIPTSEILQFERREIDGLRTGVVLAGALAAVTTVVLAIMEVSTGEELPPVLIEDQAKIPLLSVLTR